MRIIVEDYTESVLSLIEEASLAAADAMAEEIYKQSQELTPIDTGALRRSGEVVTAEQNRRRGGQFAGGFNAEVAYGGEKAPYAAIVHETNLNYRVGQWQYLRDAAMRVGRIREKVVAAYKKKMEGGARQASAALRQRVIDHRATIRGRHER